MRQRREHGFECDHHLVVVGKIVLHLGVGRGTDRHCDRDGRYSLYSQGVTEENYLRGLQEADANGRVTFRSILPAAYSGRWPHIHFEVYPSLAETSSQRNRIATSQLALPEATCKEVFATPGYEQSVRNLAQTSLDRDNVFRDGSAQQLAAMSGSVGAGYTAELSVPVWHRRRADGTMGPRWSASLTWPRPRAPRPAGRERPR